MPAQTIDELIARLDEIVLDARRRRARFGYFAALYARMTRAVQSGIQAGRFLDTAKTAELDVVFGNRYLDAVDAWRAGKETTLVWARAFSAAEAKRHLAIQHLFLGMNAHINLDLGISTAMVRPAGDVPASFHADFLEVNAVIAELVDDVQARLARISPWFSLIDWLGGRSDEVVLNFSVKKARDFAWSFAETLAALAEAERPAHIAGVDSHMARLADRITSPGPLLGLGVVLVRLAETRDVGAVLDALDDGARSPIV